MMKATLEHGKDKKDFMLNEKEFKSGRTGFHGFGKMQIGDDRYQVNLLVVKIREKKE